MAELWRARHLLAPHTLSGLYLMPCEYHPYADAAQSLQPPENDHNEGAIRMSAVVLLGYAAAFLTSLSFLPQALLVIRTRSTSGISLLMYSLFTLGVAFWLIYGIASKAAPIIAANAVTLALAATILTIAAKERFSCKELESPAPAKEI